MTETLWPYFSALILNLAALVSFFRSRNGERGALKRLENAKLQIRDLENSYCVLLNRQRQLYELNKRLIQKNKDLNHGNNLKLVD